jgi:hypothetical protein
MKNLLYVIIIILLLIIVIRSRNDGFEYRGLLEFPIEQYSCELMKTKFLNDCDIYSSDIEKCYATVNEEYYRCKEN